jgi:hypothetical protein
MKHLGTSSSHAEASRGGSSSRRPGDKNAQQFKSFDVQPELLCEILRYQPESGELFWLARHPRFFKGTKHRTAERICNQWNARYAGVKAFTATDKYGYKHGKIMDKSYFAHRVIWAMQTGAWPDAQIDHINGDRKDNRMANLREVSRSQNMHNRKKSINNTSGYKGVHFDAAKKKWRAHISINGVKQGLGMHNCPTSAAVAYAIASAKYHGEFGRVV